MEEKVVIFYTQINKAFDPIIWDQHLEILPVHIQKKLKRYKRWEDANLSLLGFLLLKDCANELGENIDLIKDLKFSQYGKPYLANSDLKFNISHAKDVTICVANRIHEIGIDIEYVSSIEIEDLYHVLTKSEIKDIKNAKKPVNEFYKIWTRKEAILKAFGHGLSDSLKNLNTSSKIGELNGQKIYTKEVPIIFENYICNIATFIEFNSHSIQIKQRFLWVIFLLSIF